MLAADVGGDPGEPERSEGAVSRGSRVEGRGWSSFSSVILRERSDRRSKKVGSFECNAARAVGHARAAFSDQPTFLLLRSLRSLRMTNATSTQHAIQYAVRS